MAEELKTNNMAYKMKGSPMLRNFGIGEKESPLKIWNVVIPAVISAATSIGIASSKSKQLKKKEEEEKRKQALNEAAEGIGGTDIGGKTKIA